MNIKEAPAPAARAPQKPMSISDLITSQQKQLEMALPRHMSGDKFVRMAITEIRKNPKLGECDAVSLLGSFIQAAQLGLEFNGMGEAYLVPYGKAATLIPGYIGLVKLVRNSGMVRKIIYEVVYERDHFDWSLGLNPKLEHLPSEASDRGPMTHVYAAAHIKGGGSEFKVMSRSQIEAHRDKFAKKPKFGPWAWETNFEAMALKTVIKQLVKLLPKNSEINVAMNLGNPHEDLTYKPQEMHQVALDAGITPPEGWEPPKETESTTIAEVLANPMPEDNAPPTAEMRQRADDAAAANYAKLHDRVTNEYAGVAAEVVKSGGDLAQILGIPDPSLVLTSWSTTQVASATKILRDWSQK